MPGAEYPKTEQDGDSAVTGEAMQYPPDVRRGVEPP